MKAVPVRQEEGQARRSRRGDPQQGGPAGRGQGLQSGQALEGRGH